MNTKTLPVCAEVNKCQSRIETKAGVKREKETMSSVKQEQSLDQTQQRESETPQVKPSTTDRVVDSK